MDNYRQLLTIFLGIVLLSGCATSSQAPSAQVRRTVRHRDLDQACAKLVVELLSDPGWREFSAEYARRVRESHPDASERDCVPLMFLSEARNGLVTRNGRPLNAKYLTERFKSLTGSPMLLNEYLRKLPTEFPEEYALLVERLGGWEPSAHPLPCIRWSAYLGRDAEKALQAVNYVANDPRVKQDGVKVGEVLPPGLAFSIEMTQNTLDTTNYDFAAVIVDYLHTDATTGSAEIVWQRFVALPEE